MFTGLIEDIGIIKGINRIGLGRKYIIQSPKITSDLKIDDSVSVNGVCLTVVKISGFDFEVEAVEESIRKTTLKKFSIGTKINLERAAKLGDRMGGHLVQGHVDCTGHIEAIIPENIGKLVWVGFPSQFSNYVVNTGSIALNGVSLTIAKAEKSRLMVSIIPHTWEITTFSNLKTGDEINIEFDIIGKYIENMVKPYLGAKNSDEDKSFWQKLIEE